MNAIIGKQRQDHKNTDRLYAGAGKCFDKLWLKKSLIEVVRIRYNQNYIKMLFEINKTAEIVAVTAIGNIESIEIKELVQQGLIFGPTICCATTGKVNDVGEKVDYNYREIEQVCQYTWMMFQQQEDQRR